MGVIGYPLARGSAARMARFRTSGFEWWLVALAVIASAGLIFASGLLDPTMPSKHDVTYARAGVVLAIGLAIVVAIELLAERFRLAWGPDGTLNRERYDSSLPAWARAPRREAAVLVAIAVFEEAAYRGIVLGGAITLWGLSDPAAAALSAGAFGAAHWYFGLRQVVLKSLLGAVLVSVALASGWVVAAAVHAGLNLVLLALERRAR